VLTLALGIAAITTVFGWIDGLVLHPFRGARDDGQLAVLESVNASGMQHQVSYADSRDFQDSLRSISGLLLSQKGPASIGEGDKPYFAWYESVSGNYFDVLGVKPVLGRAFARDEYGDGPKRSRPSSAIGCGRTIFMPTSPSSAAPCGSTGTRSPSWG
jgi:putative ABC transport system permease protein